MIHESIIILDNKVIAANNIKKNTTILINNHDYYANNKYLPGLDLVYQMLNNNIKSII